MSPEHIWLWVKHTSHQKGKVFLMSNGASGTVILEKLRLASLQEVCSCLPRQWYTWKQERGWYSSEQKASQVA